jgi:hypothetical protein
MKEEEEEVCPLGVVVPLKPFTVTSELLNNSERFVNVVLRRW